MAANTVTIRAAIEGQDEFKKSVAGINANLGDLKTKLSEVKGAYKDNANSMEALKAKSELLRQTHLGLEEKVKTVSAALENAKNTQQSYAAKVAECEAKVAGAEATLQEYAAGAGSAGKSQEELTADLERYKAALADAEKYNDAAQRGVNGWQTQLDAAQRSMSKLNSDIDKNDKYMGEAKENADGCATSIDKYGREVGSAGEETEKSGDVVETLASALEEAGVAGGLQKIAEALKACVDASVAFESTMAGVRRTIGGTDKEIAAFSQSFKDMALEIPTTTAELGKIAEAAGQMSVARGDLEQFTRVMAILSTTTDLTAENAATMLAQLSNVTGATDFERLGSTVVQLGDAAETTASKVVEMAQGMATSADMAGMSETDILAIAAALGSLDIETQTGSEAMSTMIQAISSAVETGNEQLAGFASVAGVSSAQFSKAWRVDAVGAMDTFIKGLNNTERNGKSTTLTLNEMGISSQSQVKAILALAGAGDLLTNTIVQADRAWEENTALQDRANVMYETTESKLTMAENAVNNFKIAIGDALTPALGNVAEMGGDAFAWATDFVEDNPGLVQAISVVVGTLGAFVGTLTALTALAAGVKALSVALSGMNAIPIIAIAAAAAGLVAVLGLLATTSNDAVPTVKELTTAAREMSETIDSTSATYDETVASTMAAANVADTYIDKLEKMGDYASLSAEEQTKYHNTLVLLCQTVPELADHIDLETNRIDGGTQALRDNTQAWKENAIQQAGQEKLTALYKKHADVLIEAEENSIKLTEAQDNLDTARARETDTAERIGRLYEEASNKAAAQNREYGTMADATSFLTQEYYDLEKSLTGTSNEMSAAEKTVQTCQKAIKDDADANAAAQAEIKLTEEAFKNLSGAAGGTAGNINNVNDSANSVSAQLLALNDVLYQIEGGYNLLSKAQSEMADTGYLSLDTVRTMLEKYPELNYYLSDEADGYKLTRGALEDYMAVQRAQCDTALNDARIASINLINQSGDEKVAIDETTEAIRTKIAALKEEADAKLRSLNKAFNHRSTLTESESAMYRQATEEANAYGTALNNIDETIKNSNEFDRVASSLERDSTPSRSGNTAKGDEETQKEKDLRAYQEGVRILDHERAMEEINDEEYYERKGNLAELYLKENLEEYQKWEEELYTYQKGAYDRKLKDLDKDLDAERITLEDHLQGLKDLQAEYYKEGSDEWLANQKLQEADRKAIYDRERADLEYEHDMGLIKDAEYYQRRWELMDEWLEKDSEEWRSEMVARHEFEASQQEKWDDYLKKSREDRQKAAEKAEKERNDLLKRMTDERIEQIKREQQAEEERVNAEIDAINEEIAARKRLREEQSDEDAVTKAKKVLEAAQGQLAYARDENTRVELEKEVLRAKEAYEKALQDKEDRDWEYQKQQEIKAKQDELDAIKKKAEEDIAKAEDYAEERLSKQEEARARREKAELEKLMAEELARSTQEKQRSASSALAAATQVVSKVVNSMVSNITTNHNKVSFSMPTAPLTSWQFERGVEKAMEKMAGR